ncbi:MAG: zinc carboxypeptidase [Burkholderiaceae bacterium]|nr:zinc carboxypeptidase [Burkholderiaceae bacterium]
MRHLPELFELERIAEAGLRHNMEVRRLCEVDAAGQKLPIYALALGNPDKHIPAAGFFGGIHGLERIGTQILLVFLRSLLKRLQWDPVLHRQLESVRLVFMPLVNPGGMLLDTRCNPQGVDLMRNAPLDAVDKVPFMLGGQRYSSMLPWYRGSADAPMEIESQAVCTVVEEELLARDFSLALDCHSGFGTRDRIWFPHAHTLAPIPHLPDISALEDLFSQTYPNHNYLFEPQSHHYLTHGDLWDYLYLRSEQMGKRIFLPLTLEMGSWLWVKKNPRQMLSRKGLFNPLPSHRLQRVLRKHSVWLDFLTRAACGHRRWLPQGAERVQHHERAYARWYPGLKL